MTAKQESEVLLHGLLPLAKRMLNEYGEYYPYGGYIDCEGKIVEVGVERPGTDHPNSRDLIYILKKTFREIASTNKCRAVAIVFNVTVSPPGSDLKVDAIQVCLEHMNGYSAEVFFPYSIANGEVTFGDAFAQQGQSDIFRLS
jgi:hypothetical protein